MIDTPRLFPATLFSASAFFSLLAISNMAKTEKAANPLISKITYSTTGGRSGNYESLTISADSVRYIQAHRGTEKAITEKTPEREWKSLAGAFNPKDFDRVKSNPGHALYDGIDVTLSVETGEKKFSLVNGHEDSVNYQRIRPFTNLLEKKLAALRKRIVW